MQEFKKFEGGVVVVRIFCAPSVTRALRLPRRRTNRYLQILHLNINRRVVLASKGKYFCQTIVSTTARGHYIIGMIRGARRRPF